MPLLWQMAVAALVVRVLAEQREVSEFVIECIRVETDNIRVAALMVGMAVGADGTTGTTILAVKAGFCIDVTGDFFVTVEAQSALLAAFETLVAVGAVFLVLGMRLHNLARHDQCLDLRLRRSGGGK